MARQSQLQFSWSAVSPASEAPEALTSHPFENQNLPPVSLADAAGVPHLKGLVVPEPLPEAVECGVFGMEESGPVIPDAEQIALLVREHAEELLNTIMDIDALQDGIRRGIDPRTGRAPKTEAQRIKLDEFLKRAELRLQRTRDDALAVYADAFGDENARVLEEHLCLWVLGHVEREPQYDPGHPWFYLPQGDERLPIPLNEIQANPTLMATFNEKLPRDAKKREQKLRESLEAERTGLESDKLRYQEIVERGAEALSEYDRTIAYENDEIARAGSLALTYNHLCHRLSRIRWLEMQLN